MSHPFGKKPDDRMPPDWEMGVGKAPLWTRIVAWSLAMAIIAAIVVGGLVVVLR